MKGQLIRSLIGAYGFFIAFPSVYIGGFSITFFIFILILINGGSNFIKIDKYSIYLIFFLLIAEVSSILAPISAMPRHPGYFQVFKYFVQNIYWILIAIFFYNSSKFIDIAYFAKFILIGSLFSIVGFYFLPMTIGSTNILSFTSDQTRNSFVFTIIACAPIGSLYLLKEKANRLFFVCLSIFFIALIFSNGRSGAIIIFIEILLLVSIKNNNNFRLVKILLPIIVLFVVFSDSSTIMSLKISLANKMESINPRMASLLRGEDETEGDLTFDRSWLTRQLMITKSFEIFNKYPVLGIGTDNFIYYDSDLENLVFFDRLQGFNERYLNSRSAHNSYIQVLAEYGLIGFLLLVYILFGPIILFINRVYSGKMSLDLLFSVSLFAISLHFYAISSLTGALSWVVIGLAYSNFESK